ncbi:MAG: hypothetical protein ACSLE2_01180 [Lysobacterales bacterium]
MQTIYRKLHILFATLALTLLTLNAAQAAESTLAGLWQVQITPDGAPGPVITNLVQVNKDGGVVNIDPVFGTGLGEWQRNGGRAHAIAFTHYFVDPAGAGEVVVEAALELSKDKNTAQGTFFTEIRIDNIPVDGFGGMVELIRQ